jgi:hypothetical protein
VVGNGSAEPLLSLDPRDSGSREVLLSFDRPGMGDWDLGVGSGARILLGLCIGSSNENAGIREEADVRGVPELVPAKLSLKVYWKDCCEEPVAGVTGTRRAGVSMASLRLLVNFGGDLERERARVKT